MASAALGTAATNATTRTIDISEVKMRRRHWEMSSKLIMNGSCGVRKQVMFDNFPLRQGNIISMLSGN
jgi:hypothetical protein